jgi:hypothetical protein
MRVVLAFVVVTALTAAQPAARYGVEADLKTYPQGTPKETLASVLKAIDTKRIDYLLAHLADPQFVDRRVKENGGRFDVLLDETKAKLLDDPGAAKQLRKFLSDGEWKVEENNATVKLKDVPDRAVYLRKLGDRWFLENRRKPEPVKPKDK